MKQFLSKIKSKFNNWDFILVTASTVICSGLSFIFQVYTKHLIGNYIVGIYSTCLIVLNFLNYAQCGILNAYNRDYPQALGKKDYDTAQRLKNNCMTFMLLIYTLIFIVFEAWVIIYYKDSFADRYTRYYAVGYGLCPLLMIIKSFDDMSNYTAKMNGKYNYSAIMGLVRTVLALVIGIVAVNLTGYYGLYAMTFSSAILGILFFHRYSLKGAKLSFDFPYMKTMIISGLPLLFNSLIWTLVQNVDRFVILGFLSTTDLGVYSVPLMGFTYMVLVPQSISQVFYIKISHLYGATHDERQLLDKARDFTGITAALTGGASIIVFYLMPLFVKFFMPDYTDGITATQILIIGVAIYSTTMLFGNIFSVVKLNKSLVANSIALLFFNAIFSCGLVVFVEKSIEMVAVGTACSYVLYSLMLIIKLAFKFKYSFFKLILSSWVPLLAIVVPAVLYYFIVPNLVIAAVLALFTALLVYAIILAKRRKANV